MATTAPESTGSPIMSAIGGLTSLNADMDAAAKAHQQREAGLQTNLSTVQQQKPLPPVLMNLPAKPQASNVDAMQALGNPMAILAIFGSLLTRRPMVAALNAASSAMQGWAQGNKEAYDRAETSWRDNLQLAIQQNNQEIERYRVAMESHRDDVNAALAAIQSEAAQFHDQITLDNAKAGNYVAIAQIQESRARMAEAAQNHLDMMQLRRDTLALQQQRADQINADRLVREDIAKEKLGLVKGKAGDTAKTKAADLQGMSEDLDKAIKAIQADPSLGGVYGVGRRLIGETVGQVFPGAQDKEAAQFATNIETLQARLTKPFLQAHYFTGNSAEEMEALVKGLNWRDDPTSTVTSLQKVKDILDAQIGTISGAATDIGEGGAAAADPWANYTNDQILQMLQQPPGQ